MLTFRFRIWCPFHRHGRIHICILQCLHQNHKLLWYWPFRTLHRLDYKEASHQLKVPFCIRWISPWFFPHFQRRFLYNRYRLLTDTFQNLISLPFLFHNHLLLKAKVFRSALQSLHSIRQDMEWLSMAFQGICHNLQAMDKGLFWADRGHQQSRWF